MIRELIRKIKEDAQRGGAAVHLREMPPRPAVKVPFPASLPGPLCGGLRALGIADLYAHQGKAWGYIEAGRHVIVVTPTASGKTLTYNLPVFRRVLERDGARALYVFPTKALSQDQKKSVESLAAASGVDLSVAVYDGDTTQYRRKKIRAHPPDILITNPDMIHLSMLAYHASFETFWRNLSVVVLDEIHTYKGVFGSHIVQVMRRLRRVADLYGASPRFVACSATIANAGAFAQALTGLPFSVIDRDGSPSAARHFLFVNPEGESPYSVSSRVFASAIEAGAKTIAFTKARKITELMHARLTRSRPRWRDRISSYRAGFLPTERREIENRLSSGELDGVISTSALEVGIDIGGLDVCVLVGFPGTLVNAWQRGGRVGRGDRESLVVLVGQRDALDQYYLRHPDEFFDRSFESAVVDPGNPQILKAHLECAAVEAPLRADEDVFEPDPAKAAAAALERENRLVLSADGKRWFPTRLRPHRNVDIRSIGRGFSILLEGTKTVIGSVSGWRALTECHQGAVYLHKGRQYGIRTIDMVKGNIFAAPLDADFYTKTVGEKETEILETLRRRPVGNVVLNLGRLRVTERILGYQKRHTFTQETISQHPLEIPPNIFETVGVWFEMPPGTQDAVVAAGGHFMGGIHAGEHAMIAVFPMFALCDPGDVGGISTTYHPQVKGPSIFLYDGTPGGVGLCERAFDVMEALLERTRKTVQECPCEDGCPSCIHSPKCGSGNVPLDKKACAHVLQLLTEGPPPEPAVPGPPPEEILEEPPVPREAVDVASLLAERDVVVFDLETQRSAADVGGWHNAHLMRLAVGVSWHSRTDEMKTWWEKDVEDLIAALEAADLVVGFNCDRFDLKVLAGYTSPDRLGRLKTFDLLAEVKERLGFRLSLNALAAQTLEVTKTADGLQSLKWWAAGERDKVRDYCEHDVAITRDLFLKGVEEGFWIYERKGERVRLTLDWDLREILEG